MSAGPDPEGFAIRNRGQPSAGVMEELGAAFAKIVGADHVQPATERDAIDGVQPRWVVAPGTADEVAVVLRAATEAGAAVAPRGSGTKLGWGNPPCRLDAIVSLKRLSTLEEHAWGDMTATAQAGIPLPPLDPGALSRWGGVFFVFPHYFVLPQYGNALTYRFRPLADPEHCLLELWSITIPAPDEDFGRPVRQGPFAPDDPEHWPPIPLQDFANITRQQRGLHNRTFNRSHISPAYECGIANMHLEVDRYLASPLAGGS